METHNEFFVGWGTLALINGNLAQCKGRHALGWFVVSLLVGPIATLLLLFITPIATSSTPKTFDLKNFSQ